MTDDRTKPGRHQLSFDDAKYARDEAIARVERGVGAEWMAHAAIIIASVARQKAQFTADDLWDAGLLPPDEPRALGAAMNNARRAGICSATPRFVLTRRTSRHAAPIRVWLSELFDGFPVSR